MDGERDDAAGLEGGGAGPRVYDIREWTARPTLRRVGAPRALWARQHADARPATPAPITPVRQVPVRTGPAVRTAVANPVLLLGCSESPALERLALGLGASAILRNLGGIAPRSPRGRFGVDELEASLEASLRLGQPLQVACVGHLGCHAIRASSRYAVPGDAATMPDRSVRAVEHHVFLQVHRVRTYLRLRGSHPEVHVSGLWIDEGSGHVRAFDPARRAFAPLTAFDLRPFATPVPARAD